jgi:hypothetical protein
MNGLLPVTHPPTGAKNAVPVQFAPVYTVTAAQVSHDFPPFHILQLPSGGSMHLPEHPAETLTV